MLLSGRKAFVLPHVFPPMKLPLIFAASLMAGCPLFAETPPAPAPAPPPAPAPVPARDPANDLAKPLRKYDTNKDGQLTGDELRLARQAFNRGGKAPEMSADDWQGVLDYFKGDWRKRNFSKLDLNADGKLDDAEKERVQKIWGGIAAQLTTMRAELVLKYDKNDDGNVTREERRAFDPEFGRRRFEIEADVLTKQEAAEQAAKEQKEKAAAAAVQAAPTTPIPAPAAPPQEANANPAAPDPAAAPTPAPGAAAPTAAPVPAK